MIESDWEMLCNNRLQSTSSFLFVGLQMSSSHVMAFEIIPDGSYQCTTSADFFRSKNQRQSAEKKISQKYVQKCRLPLWGVVHQQIATRRRVMARFHDIVLFAPLCTCVCVCVCVILFTKGLCGSVFSMELKNGQLLHNCTITIHRWVFATMQTQSAVCFAGPRTIFWHSGCSFKVKYCKRSRCV